MKIIKRSGVEVAFDSEKIAAAAAKANAATTGARELTPGQIRGLADRVEAAASAMGRTLSVEEIQELVETELMKEGAYETAKRYIRYRYTRSLARAANTTDEQILTLIESNNEEVKQENSNKDPKVNAVQRDYMAGEVSKDITRRILLPQEIVEAHQQGIIHFHDMRLLRPAHAQLRPGESGGHAAKRHRHLGHHDRKAPLLLHRLQHRHPDHRTGGLQPVRRAVHQPGPPGPLCGCLPQEDPPRTSMEECRLLNDGAVNEDARLRIVEKPPARGDPQAACRPSSTRWSPS